MKPRTEKFVKQRRFIMVLPMLVLPFLTMIFWALGGGSGVPATTIANDITGLNPALPDAQFAEKEIWDKLALYEQAQRDSARYEEARESDPYFDLIAFKTHDQQPAKKSNDENASKLINSFPQKDHQLPDPNEERVTKKLQQLYDEINKPSASYQQPVTANGQPGLPPEALEGKAIKGDTPQDLEEIDRLEMMMEMLHDNSEPDPEMQQIESVLEKILDIQHPDRVKQRLQQPEQSKKANSLPVELVKADDTINVFGSADDFTQQAFDSIALTTQRSVFTNGFFGLDDEVSQAQTPGNTIAAIIHDTQELVAGSTVKLRLASEVTISGNRLPKDQFIYGTCAINDERLIIQIDAIRIGNTLLPVSLSVYDLDGLEGIYIPGAITRDAAKQASDNALQNVQLMSIDPSIGAQAAAAGVEAAKGLFSKKAKQIKVTVKAGYQVLLVDTNPTTATTYQP